MKNINLFLLTLLFLLVGCDSHEDQADAYGNFEAIEVMVSSEIQGKVVEFGPHEGDRLEKGAAIAQIDTTQLHLKMKQLKVGVATLNAKLLTIDAQVRASRVQLGNMMREKTRIDNLFAGGAATSKQQDDIKGQIALLEAQIVAAESQKATIDAERNNLGVQIQQIEDQLLRCTVRSPIEGIMLIKYKEEGEVAGPGQPFMKIANLDRLILRAYISGEQLSAVKIGDQVTVRYDGAGGTGQTTGVLTWVSPSAEFTPKIIQTKKERVNLVYAIKVEVPNEGRLKIGMPGEVYFN